MAVKITDLVDQSAIDQLIKLNDEIRALRDVYSSVAQELSKGLDVPVKVSGDLDKLNALLAEKTREAAAAQAQLTTALERQQAVIGQTTPVISRQLMEMERVNRTQRDAYTEHKRVNEMLDRFNDTYENQVKALIRVNDMLAANKREQKANEQQLAKGNMTQQQYAKELEKLVMQQRALSQEKSRINQIMRAEEKASASLETSYVHMSQQLELMKKAYKELDAESRDSQFGLELAEQIQNLDAHLKDVAADMGEFQRNVGNYAIACNNGVATTQSIVAAISQEAVTTQDLIDQSKLLTEAKAMLSQSDEKYAETLAAINAKLEQNAAKLSDVSDILGTQPKTVAEAEEQNKRLKEALRHVDTSADGATERIAELNAQIDQNKAYIEEVIPDTEKLAKEQEKLAKQQEKDNETLTGQMLSILGVNESFGESLTNLKTKGSVMDGLKGKISSFGTALMGLLANPYVLALLGIAGVAAGFKWWWDYNEGLEEASKKTTQFTGKTGDEMKATRSAIQATADAYGKDFEEVLKATNALAKQMGVDFDVALKLVQDGFIAGADANGEYLDTLKEYPAYVHEAGISADQLIAILAQASKMGVFSDKAIDSIKEGNLRLREMTKGTAEALRNIGIDAAEVQKKLADGSITTWEVMKMVSEKLSQYPASAQEVGTAIADIFGGAGEDAGYQYLAMLKDMDTNLDNVKKKGNALADVEARQLELNTKLAETVAAMFDQTDGGFQRMNAEIKAVCTEGLLVMVESIMDIYNWFVRIYNAFPPLRLGIQSLIAYYKLLGNVAVGVFKGIVNGFKSTGELIEAVVTGQWSKIGDIVKKGFAGSWEVVKQTGKDIADAYIDGWNEGMDGGNLKEAKLPTRKTTTAVVGGGDDNKGGGGKATDPFAAENAKNAKEAAKEAKETLKLLAEIDEAKISLMRESHAKEILIIQLNYRKKIEAIVGNGKNEQEMRLLLLKQMNDAIAKSDEEYYKEMAKINLDNRLAAAKEGSKEEMELKIALLVQQYNAEIKEAEKTGADVALITAKYEKEKAAIKTDYANKQSDAIAQRYADEASQRDAAMVLELAKEEREYGEKLKAAKGNAEAIERIKAEHQDKVSSIEERYARQTAQAAIKALEEQLKTEDLSAEERLKLEQALAKAKADQEKLLADQSIAQIERVTEADKESAEKRKQNAQQWMQIAADGLNAISGLANAIFDGQIQRIEEEQEANEAAATADEERISKLVESKVITEEEGEARKRAALATTAAKNEELEAKKQKIKQRQAVWDKMNSIAQAAIATALAITQALPNVVLAAIAGAMGAIQIATIVATPIPKYAKGTDYHKGGLAMVGDGGRQEVVLIGNSAWVTPSTPTYVDLPEGARVLPSLDRMTAEIADANARRTAVMSLGKKDEQKVVINNDYKRLEERLDNLAHLMRVQTKQQHSDAVARDFEVYKRMNL